MSSLEQAINELQRQLQAYLAQSETALSAFQASLDEDWDLLACLKSQSVYPQFYLHFRDEEKILIALGEVRSFFSLDLAQDFIENQDMPLIGGLEFQGKGRFVLPQLLIEQTPQGAQLRCFVEGQASAQGALSLLKTLPKSTALCALSAQTPLRIEPRASRREWQDWVNQALDAIERGELTKLVLANETLFHLKTRVNAYDFLAQSKQHNQGCYHFLWAENPSSHFVGSTPERLFAREYNLLLTEALAGTAPMNEDESHNQQQGLWLLNDEKNRQENWLVVEGIRHNLRPLVEELDVGDVMLKPLRKVQHLCRKIRANLKAHYADAALLQAIHPTAAIAGLPQQEARMAVAEIETFDRSWYAGTLGIMSAACSEFCVAIRSAFIEGNRIRVFAGAGIVAGSEPLSEWKEIERKAAGLVSLFVEQNGEKLCQ